VRHIATILLLVLVGCIVDLDPVFVPVVDRAVIDGTKALDVTSKRDLIDGVYEVDESGSDLRSFGTIVSARLASNGQVNLYASFGVSFFTLDGGTRNDSAIFTGTWRAVQGPRAGAATFIVEPDEGGRDLADGSTNNKMVLRGLIRTGNGPAQRLVLRRVAKLNDDIKDFQIIAHRGGGRNSERLGVSENSLPMIRLASQLGATAIEIDVLATKDGVPVVFHDETLTPRTVQGSYLIGNVANYTYDQLRRHARLVNGETIPTLEEALDVVINETELQMVWIDVKDPSIATRIMEIQIAKINEAALRGRQLRFLFGIPDEDVLEQFESSTLRSQVETLCELSPDIATRIDAAVWAPRFTAGVQRSHAERMHDEGRDVYVWTLDDPNFMQTFLSERYKGRLLYTGILTNYPTLLASRFYSSKVKK
jgi:glycerophosphoryl diester phosphodiesterase